MWPCARERTRTHTQPGVGGQGTHHDGPREHDNASQKHVLASCTCCIQRCARAGVCETALQHANSTSPAGAGCSALPASMNMMLTHHERPRFPPRAQNVRRPKLLKRAGSAPVRARQTCAGMCDYKSATHICTRYLRAHESNGLTKCSAAPCSAAGPFSPSSSPSPCPHRAAKKCQGPPSLCQSLLKYFLKGFSPQKCSHKKSLCEAKCPPNRHIAAF